MKLKKPIRKKIDESLTMDPVNEATENEPDHSDKWLTKEKASNMDTQNQIVSVMNEILHSMDGLYHLWVDELYEYTRSFTKSVSLLNAKITVCCKPEDDGYYKPIDLRDSLSTSGIFVSYANLYYDMCRRDQVSLQFELTLIGTKFFRENNWSKENHAAEWSVVESIINGYVTSYGALFNVLKKSTDQISAIIEESEERNREEK